MQVIACEECGQKNRVDETRITESNCGKCGWPLFLPEDGFMHIKDIGDRIAYGLDIARKNERSARTMEAIAKELQRKRRMR